MINFFAILLILFTVFLVLILKREKLKNAIKIKKNYHKEPPNNKNIPTENRFSYNNKNLSYSRFYRNSLRYKMIKLFQSSSTKNKLKALKIAEELADKSTLPILRKGLRDTSPMVVEISATLIKNFK